MQASTTRALRLFAAWVVLLIVGVFVADRLQEAYGEHWWISLLRVGLPTAIVLVPAWRPQA